MACDSKQAVCDSMQTALDSNVDGNRCKFESANIDMNKNIYIKIFNIKKNKKFNVEKILRNVT